MTWREQILNKLKLRNINESDNIRDLINFNHRLLEQNGILKSENLKLTFQAEQFRQGSPLLLQPTANGNVATSLQSSVVVRQLEQKLYKLQEELTDLHRTKGENAKQLLEINQFLQERDKAIAAKDNKISNYESEILILKEELSERELQLQECQCTVQLLRDEYQALNLACTTLEESNKKLKNENQELIHRLMEWKAKDAEKLNEENDAALRLNQLKLEARLQEAATEARVINVHSKFACTSPLCIYTSVPSRAYFSFEAHEGEVNAVTFSPQGKYLATGGADRKIKLWDISSGKADSRGMLIGSNAGITAVQFDADEALIVGASNDYASRIWTVQDHRLRHTLTGHSGKVMAAKFLSESSKLVTGSHDRTIKIWDLKTIACTKTLFAGSSCTDLIFSDFNATTIISGHFDKKIRFWDTRSEKAASELLLSGKITSLSCSTDGFSVLVCTRDDSLCIVDLRSVAVKTRFISPEFHVGTDYTRATFSPDSTYVAAGGHDGGIYIWDASTGELMKALHEHSSCAIACSWHPTGRTLASCERSKKVIAWCDF